MSTSVQLETPVTPAEAQPVVPPRSAELAQEEARLETEERHERDRIAAEKLAKWARDRAKFD